MNLNNFNNLIELFFYQAKKQNPKSILLQWLNPNNKQIFTWGDTKKNIFKLSKAIREKYISSLQHAGDMGIELCKAELALKNNLNYVQDKDLNIFDK